MKLKNKRIIVTGASEGFGFAAAKAFVLEGANVVLCARDEKKLEGSLSKLREIPRNKEAAVGIPADVSNPDEVESLIRLAIDTYGGIDVLLCNAGVYGPKGPIEDTDWKAWTRAIEINLMGTVLPCRAVLPAMKSQKGGKIIIMSGGGATKPMPFLSAYASSKAAVVRFAETLAEEAGAHNIEVNSVAPGALNTRMLDEVLEAGPERIGQSFYNQMVKTKEKGGTPLDVGVSLCTYLSSDVCVGLTGKLISAVWDPWADFAKHRQDLQETDIYTLRRIVPKERGKAWGEK